MKKDFSLEYFSAQKWVFVLVVGGKVLYRSKNQGLKPLIFCLKKYKKQMRGAMVFDKIVGRAAALLLCYGGVKKVLTPTITRNALAALARGGARVQYQKIVKNILNRAGDDLCPMEKLSRGKNATSLAKALKISFLLEK